MRWVIAVAAGLLLGQLVTGTAQVYAQLVFLFVVLAGVAINLAGGPCRLGGFCITMMSLKIVIISQAAKALAGEPGDSRLEMPQTTISVLLVGMASITIAVALLRLIRVKKPLFVADPTPENLKLSAIITFALGAISHLGVLSTGMEEGQLQVGGLPGLLRQLSFCISLSVIFSTAYVVQESAGRVLFGWFNAIPTGLFFALCVISSSKTGMFEPLLLVALTGAAFRYRFSLGHAAAAAAFVALSLGVLFPFGQVARNYTRGSGLMESVSLTAKFMVYHFGSLEGFREL